MTGYDNDGLAWITKINGLTEFYIEIERHMLGDSIIESHQDGELDVNRYRYDVSSFKKYVDLPNGHLMCCYGEFDKNTGEIDDEEEYDTDLHVFIAFEILDHLNNALTILNSQT